MVLCFLFCDFFSHISNIAAPTGALKRALIEDVFTSALHSVPSKAADELLFNLTIVKTMVSGEF